MSDVHGSGGPVLCAMDGGGRPVLALVSHGRLWRNAANASRTRAVVRRTYLLVLIKSDMVCRFPVLSFPGAKKSAGTSLHHLHHKTRQELEPVHG